MSINEKNLIKILGLYSFVTSLAGIFLTIFIFRIGGFKIVSEYNLLLFIVLYIIFLISGYLLKKYTTSTLIKVGFLLGGVEYLLVFLLREKTIDFIPILSAIHGISAGLFWSANNFVQYIETKEHTRNEFFGKQYLVSNISATFGPIIGGTVIYSFSSFGQKDFGYSFLFLIVAILLFFLTVVSGILPKYSGISYSLKHLFLEKRKHQWNIVLFQQFLFGLYDVSFNSLSTILIFLIIQKELTLGFVNAASSIVFAIANLVAIKILNKKHYSFLLGMIFVPLGLFLFGLQQNLFGLFTLLIIYYGFSPFLSIPTSKVIYDTVDSHNKHWKDSYTHLVQRDTMLGAGRIISYAFLFFMFSQFNKVEIAKNWIMFIPIFPILIGGLQFYLKKLSKNS